MHAQHARARILHAASNAELPTTRSPDPPCRNGGAGIGEPRRRQLARRRRAAGSMHRRRVVVCDRSRAGEHQVGEAEAGKPRAGGAAPEAELDGVQGKQRGLRLEASGRARTVEAGDGRDGGQRWGVPSSCHHGTKLILPVGLGLPRLFFLDLYRFMLYFQFLNLICAPDPRAIDFVMLEWIFLTLLPPLFFLTVREAQESRSTTAPEQKKKKDPQQQLDIFFWTRPTHAHF